MKRILIALLALLLLFSLAACGTNTEREPSEVSAPGISAVPEQIENKVDLALDKTRYERGERVETTLRFDKLDRDAAVIVIVSSGCEHGSETAVHDDYEEYRYIADFTELPFYLWAPDRDGLFDVRVYENSEGGKELACISIAVGNAELAAPISAGAAAQADPGSGGLIGNDSAATYAEAYNKYAAAYSAMNDTFTAILTRHNEAIEQSDGDYWENPEHFSDVVMCCINIPIAYTSTLGESGYEVSVAALLDAFSLKEGSVEELDAANYRLTYLGVYNDPVTWESVEDAPWESLCGFDAAKGSLYFRHYVTLNGEKKLDSFIECVPLGGGRYALQSEFERGIVELLDGKAASFEYAAFNTPFDVEADTIFPDFAGADTAWVTAGDGMYQHITLTSDSLHIWADEIADGLLAAPVRDITIAR